MIKWFANLFATSKIDKKKKKLASLQRKAFEAQRNGNLSLSGKYLLEAEILETEIIEINKKGVKQ